MGKDKLRRFAEITAFDNVIELEDGKVLKSELYFKPDIRSVLNS